MVEIICVTLSGFASVLVAVVSHKIDKTTKATEERAARRKEESMLSLELTMASVELTEVCANAMTGGKNNGNVEQARQRVSKAKQRYKDFERRIVAEEIV